MEYWMVGAKYDGVRITKTDDSLKTPDKQRLVWTLRAYEIFTSKELDRLLNGATVHGVNEGEYIWTWGTANRVVKIDGHRYVKHMAELIKEVQE